MARGLQKKTGIGFPTSSMKRLALAGFSEIERAEIVRLLGRAGTTLDEPWQLAGGDDGRADLLVIDPEQFAGRVARVRAFNERTNVAVVVDASAERPEAWLVLRRPLSTESLVETLNRAACCDENGVPREQPKPIVDAPSKAANDDDAPPAGADTRASFERPRGPRVCTDFNALLQRGPIAIERAGLPRLVIDPANGAFHANAPLSKLEPYVLDPIKPGECRQLPQSRLADVRASAPPQPVAQLHWLGALLRSNGCLGAHLDPGGTYRVKRWMSIYGEYRKQYRIATLMLRPLRLHEIARKAEATMIEVFDVVNAYDAIGLLQWEPRASRHAAAAVAPERRSPTPSQGTTRRLLAAALLTR